jgi:predicted kinase
MGVIEKIVVSDETLKRLEQDARAHGRSVAEEAAARIEAPRTEVSREQLVARMRAFRDSLPPQTTDSLTLLQEDRAGNRY